MLFGSSGRVFCTESLAQLVVTEVGGVIVNDLPNLPFDNMPYGGVERSGVGREGVRYAYQETTTPKVLLGSR